MFITNTRIESSSNRDTLEKHLQIFKDTPFFQQIQWPMSNVPTTYISSLFEKHPYDTYLYNNPLSNKTKILPEPPSANTALHNYYTMTTDSLKKVYLNLYKIHYGTNIYYFINKFLMINFQFD